MSRLGKKPIFLEPGVKVLLKDKFVSVEGLKGMLNLPIPSGIKVILNENKVELSEITESTTKNMQGLFRTLLQNAITGVTKEWCKTLELIGVGYRAQTAGNELNLNLGFSHPIKITAPAGISFKVNENKISVLGVDKYLVGEVAASIRRLKKPEPYKGKGIRYEGEFIRKKLGKAAKTVGGITTK